MLLNVKKSTILKTWFILKYHNSFESATYLAKTNEEIRNPLYNLHYKLNGAYRYQIYSVF